MDNIASYVSERISDLEMILGDVSDISEPCQMILYGKLRAFEEIEDYLAGNLEEDDYETAY